MCSESCAGATTEPLRVLDTASSSLPFLQNGKTPGTYCNPVAPLLGCQFTLRDTSWDPTCFISFWCIIAASHATTSSSEGSNHTHHNTRVANQRHRMVLWSTDFGRSSVQPQPVHPTYTEEPNGVLKRLWFLITQHIRTSGIFFSQHLELRPHTC